METPPFWMRVVVTVAGVCAASAAAGSLSSAMWKRRIDRSEIRQIGQRIQAITPDVERRDHEVEELTTGS